MVNIISWTSVYINEHGGQRNYPRLGMEDQDEIGKRALFRDIKEAFICNIAPWVIKQSIHILERSQV